MAGDQGAWARGWLAVVQRLRSSRGKRAADILLVAGVAIVAAAAALALSTTTPFRFVENFTYDLRESLAPRPRRPTSSW